MSLLSYIIPRTVLRLSTKYNRDIRVIEESGRYKLLVETAIQTGPFTRDLWKKALTFFRVSDHVSVRSILVLGVGGGDIIKFLYKLYPSARIVGVDIDPAIISICKTYFELDSIPTLRLVTQDAQKYIEKANRHFDFIVVDLFHGRRVSSFVQSPRFMKSVYKRLSVHGVVLVNFMHDGEYEVYAKALANTLTKLYSSVSIQRREYNELFFVRK